MYASRIISVPSGSFQVESTDNVLLQAHLGTCVGLALWDPQSGVSGLYHILLPEPFSENGGGDPLKYAQSGLPIFLQAILEAGARKERLQAVVAGGALVGHVTMGDLELDIGGRTTTRVMNFLKEEGIPVRESETRGYFSCRLELYTGSDPQVYIKPTVNLDPDYSIPRPVREPELLEAIKRVRPIPQTALRIIRMLNTSTYEMGDLAQEIRSEQVLSARVITLSNSPLLGVGTPVDSVDRALVLLGEKRILQLVLTIYTELFFQDVEQSYSLCKGGLYHHALGTAVVAESLAAHADTHTTDVAYTAGLLHDIGKVVLDQWVAAHHPYFYRLVFGDGRKLVEIEREYFGISHAEAGARLAEAWKLPANLQAVIAHHHDPQQSEQWEPLVRLVYVANLLMSRFQSGLELNNIGDSELEKSLEVLGMTPSRLLQVIGEVPWAEL